MFWLWCKLGRQTANNFRLKGVSVESWRQKKGKSRSCMLMLPCWLVIFLLVYLIPMCFSKYPCHIAWYGILMNIIAYCWLSLLYNLMSFPVSFQYFLACPTTLKRITKLAEDGNFGTQAVLQIHLAPRVAWVLVQVIAVVMERTSLQSLACLLMKVL